MEKSRKVLLVGSIPLEDERAVFRALADHVGACAPRFPDGETGQRINWIRWQRHIFDDNPAFELASSSVGLRGYQDTLERPFFRLWPGIEDIKFKPLGFAAQAAKSFAAFSKLQADGVIPTETRFQISIPTVLAIVSGFVVMEDRAKVEQALEAAMKQEVQQLAASLPRDQISIQWDVCHEIVGTDGGYDLHFGDILENAVERVRRQVEFVPADIEVGIHLCYGDPGHKHIVEPKDLRTCVNFSNALCAAVKRRIGWIHMPVPRGWLSESYYAPLADLRLPSGTELYLGLVHYTDGVEGTRKRMELASRFIKEFGLATECGFGRREPATIPKLLDIHRNAAIA
jgi:hypothetical protein